MNPLIPFKNTLILPLLVALACLVTLPAARAVSPPPDGGYPGENTAEGTNALFSLASGIDNTAVGFDALLRTPLAGRIRLWGLQRLVAILAGI